MEGGVSLRRSIRKACPHMQDEPCLSELSSLLGTTNDQTPDIKCNSVIVSREVQRRVTADGDTKRPLVLFCRADYHT